MRSTARTGQPRRARGDGARGATRAANPQRGPQILADGRGRPAAARGALTTWKDVTFNYASTDTSDFVRPVAAPEEPSCALHKALFSVLPDLTDEQIGKQVEYALQQGLGGPLRWQFTDEPHPATSTGRCGACGCSDSEGAQQA